MTLASSSPSRISAASRAASVPAHTSLDEIPADALDRARRRPRLPRRDPRQEPAALRVRDERAQAEIDPDDIAAKHGWSYNGGRDWRTRVIYRTNLRTSYAAGRWRQLQAGKERRPYWRYRHSAASEDPRPEHLAWDGIVLSADDPWWNTHYPPNGWGCNCFVEALNRRDLKRLGKDGPDNAPPLEERTKTVGRDPVRTVEVPKGIDPGFAYAPGRMASLGEAVVERLRATGAQAASIGAAGAAEMLARPRTLAALGEKWRQWRWQPGGGTDFMPVGNVSTAVQKALKTEGIELQTSQVTIRRAEVKHTLRVAKKRRLN